MRRPGGGKAGDPPGFGIEEGVEARVGEPGWTQLNPVVDSVLECHLGSSSLGLMEDEWFSILVQAVTADQQNALSVGGIFLGTEDPNMVQFVEDRVTEGGVHLCLSQPCAPTPEVSAEAVRVTRVRCWRIGSFKADYLTDKGKKAMKDALAAEKGKLLASSKAKAKSAPGAGKKKAKGEADPNKLKKDGKKPSARPRASKKKPGGAEVIDLASGRDRRRGRGEARWCSGRPGAPPRSFQQSQGPYGRQNGWEDRGGGRRGFSWWNRAKATRTCSGRDEVGEWYTSSSRSDDPIGHRGQGGFKRWSYLQFEEEEEPQVAKKHKRAAVGTSSPSRGIQEQPKEKEEQRGRKASQFSEEGCWRKEEEKGQEKEEKKEGREEEDGYKEGVRRPRRLGRRGFRELGVVKQQQQFRRRGQQVRSQLRAPFEEKSTVESGQCDGRFDSSRSGADGSRCSFRPGWSESRGHARDQDVDLLCVADKALLSSREPSFEGAICSGSGDRSFEDGEAGRDGRRLGQQIRGSAYSHERWQLADGCPTRALPSGAGSERQHECYAESSETPKVALEVPGLHQQASSWKRRLVAFWGRRKRIRERVRKRKEGQEQAQRKRLRWRRRKLEGRLESLEGEQGRAPKEELRRQKCFTERIQRTNGVRFEDMGLKYFYDLASWSSSLSKIGCALAWLVANRSYDVEREEICMLIDRVVLGSWRTTFAMQRGRSKTLRSPFPLPLGDVSPVYEEALKKSHENFCLMSSEAKVAEDAWVITTISALNGLAGKSRAVNPGDGSKLQRRALAEIRASVKRMLSKDIELHRCSQDIEKELASRFVSYTGEEVPKMQVLSVEQVLPALPPASHGGSIFATDLVCEGTRKFLENPLDSLREVIPQDLRVLQAKVHVAKGEETSLSKLLVSRNICTWVPEEDVLRVGGCRVLNGLFGVGKGKFLDDGREIQRVIMNLIPSNHVFEQAKGYMDSLPSITQYLSLVLDGKEEIHLHQSDMSSAFYLFAIPSAWSPCLCFNICRRGEDIGCAPNKNFFLACAVIPMGWSSAVSIMQEIADRLTTIGRLPPENKVRRNCPLPYWMVETLEQAKGKQHAWYHVDVYLDNFCSMGKTLFGEKDQSGSLFHHAIEEAWEKEGVLNSVNKRISNSDRATELGAEVDGREGTLGPSAERLTKLIQATLLVIGRPNLNHKWVQVIAGRWVHVLAFRRPGMVVLDSVWAFISRKQRSKSLEHSVRSELFHCAWWRCYYMEI